MKTALTATIVLGVFGLLTSACGNDSSSTTAPTTTSPSTEVFSGTLAVQGSSFYSFTVVTSGTVSVTLASLVATPPGPALKSVVGLGVGTPLETDCSVTNSVTAAPGLTAQLVSSLTPAVYCVRIYDLGNLPVPVNFSIRIVHN
jgi:hypothetical protein